VPVSGGAPPSVFATTDAELLAIDASNLYWITQSPSALMKAPLGSGSPTVLVSGIVGNPYGGTLAAGGGYVFWANSNQPLARTSVAGGAVTTVSSGAAGSFGVSDRYVAWWDMVEPVTGGPPVQLAGGGIDAVDDTHVYWVSESDGYCNGATIQRVAIPTGPIETLSSEPGCTSPPLLDATSIYWEGSGQITRLAKDGGQPVAVANVADANGGGPFTLGPTAVFWAEGFSILKADK